MSSPVTAMPNATTPIRPSMDSTKTFSTSSSTSILKSSPLSSSQISLPKRAWTSLVKHAKEHHDSVTTAHKLYYGGAGWERSTSGSSSSLLAVSGSSSEEELNKEVKEELEGQGEGGMKKAWERVKRHAKEHHQSVNGAYRAYYGAGVYAPRNQN